MHVADTTWTAAELYADYSIKVSKDRYLCNNASQTKAIRSAMNKRLTLIQGPPGWFCLCVDTKPNKKLSCR